MITASHSHTLRETHNIVSNEHVTLGCVLQHAAKPQASQARVQTNDADSEAESFSSVNEQRVKWRPI